MSSKTVPVPATSANGANWRGPFETARTFLSGRVARLRELELELSKKDYTLRKLQGSGAFQWNAPIVVGVCAMGKKATCKPMREILARLPQNEFEIKIFEERAKVEAYVKLRKPSLVNDLGAQRWLWDRRTVYKICEENDIPVPNHIIVNRDKEEQDVFNETDDYVEVNGKKIYKPFVEKPVDAEDGSYIYEEFLTTEGTDVKVYAVTMDYAHAEARKSPVMDGRVIRDDNNVEVRYPVILSNYEKDLARKVVKSFRQNVCGFDMLRSGGRSYVCDVNGWSFVKRSARYHKDSSLMLARVMRQMMGRPPPTPASESDSETDDDEDEDDDTPLMKDDNISGGDMASPVHGPIPSRDAGGSEPSKKRHEELRAVVAIIRHGDRTPKQKLKMIVTDRRFLCLFAKHGKKDKDAQMALQNSVLLPTFGPTMTPSPTSATAGNSVSTHLPSPPPLRVTGDLPELKLKTAKELGEVLRITNEILFENSSPRAASPGTEGSLDTEEGDSPSNQQLAQIEALTQVRAVLEMHGTFKGINRKVQLRCTQLSPGSGEPVEAQLILKWGGVLTPPGRERAETMGRSFRERMYPGIDGLIRLHSTYRHDLKIYASDEGRVQVTAAAFAKGLLDLEGHLTPILESLVKKGPEINVLLHDASLAQNCVTEAKQKLKRLLTSPQDDRNTAELPLSVQKALESLDPDGPISKMSELHQEIIALAAQLKYHLRTGGKNVNMSKMRGSVTATAFRGLRARSASVAESSILVDASAGSPFTQRTSPGSSLQATPSEIASSATTIAEGGGTAALSLGTQIDLDSNEEKVDRGDGAVTVRDLFHLACARWEKLQVDFFRKDVFDISKIPDIYDCAKYDITHNPEMLKLQPRHLLRVYELSKHLADAVVPQEYGETHLDKFEVGIKTCSTLLGKIRDDLRLAAEEGAVDKSDSATDDSRSVTDSSALGPGGGSDLGEGGFVEGAGYRLDRRLAKSMGIKNANRHVRTRLYFTSESHLHAVMNVLRFAHIADPSLPKPHDTGLRRLSEADEMSYLCHIVLRLYEVTEPNGLKHHSLRIYVSDGISVKVFEEPAHLDVNGLPGDVRVHVGTHPEKPLTTTKPISAVADLHSTGFGFSSFNQIVPISPAAGAAGRVQKQIGGHHIKMLPPANPMIPLWLHLPLSEGMRLFDPNLIELIPSIAARVSDTPASPGSASASKSAQLSKPYPMQRFDSNVHGVLRPSWNADLEDEDEHDIV